MPKHVPAYAGFFRITLTIPGDPDWCVENKAGFDRALTSMVETGFGQAVGAMPSTRVESEGSYAELILEWVRHPGLGPWDAVESVVETAQAVFPDFLRVTDALRVEVERQASVGRDVVLSDEEVARLEAIGDREAGFPDAPPAS